MKDGYISLHRSIQKHWIYEEKRKFSKYEAWLDLLMMVNYKDNKTLQDGQLVEVKRGERITSIRQLMDRWDWSNTKVVKFLELLSQDEMITFEVTPKKKTLIKIVKYEQYQGDKASNQSEEKTEKRQEKDTGKTQNNINNKDNKDNKDNKKKKKTSSHKYEICDMENAKLLFSLIENNLPGTKEPNFDKWANDFRLLREKDEKPDGQIKWLIEWSQNDPFWKTNILSPAKLREKWIQLTAKAKADHEKKQKIKKKSVDFQALEEELANGEEGNTGINKTNNGLLSEF